MRTLPSITVSLRWLIAYGFTLTLCLALLARQPVARAKRSGNDGQSQTTRSRTLSIQKANKPLQLRVAANTDLAQTGGLSAEEAARRAGIDPLIEKYQGFYREQLRSWFFVREDRSAVALRRKQASRLASNQKAPSAYEWEVIPLPNMDQTAPEQFGVDLGKVFFDYGTRMLLRPDLFADIIEKSPPDNGAAGIGERFVKLPGAVTLHEKQFWTMLERAQREKIDLRLVTVRAISGKAVRLLSAGVDLDALQL